MSDRHGRGSLGFTMKPYTVRYVMTLRELPSVKTVEVLAADRAGAIEATVKKLHSHDFLIMKIEEG